MWRCRTAATDRTRQRSANRRQSTLLLLPPRRRWHCCCWYCCQDLHHPPQTHAHTHTHTHAQLALLLYVYEHIYMRENQERVGSRSTTDTQRRGSEDLKQHALLLPRTTSGYSGYFKRSFTRPCTADTVQEVSCHLDTRISLCFG